MCLEMKPLIKAHIIPYSFYSKCSTTKLYADKLPYSKKRPKGAYDSTILCGECDGKIGKLDHIAKQILIDRIGISRHEVKNPDNPNNILIAYKLTDKSLYDKLNRFFISLLWRASVSTLEDFNSISLGPFESIAKNMIFSSDDNFKKYFTVHLLSISDLKGSVHLYTDQLSRIQHVNFYIWIIAGYKIFIKVDKRPLPSEMNTSNLCFENDLLMLEAKLCDLPECLGMIDMLNKRK